MNAVSGVDGDDAFTPRPILAQILQLRAHVRVFAMPTAAGRFAQTLSLAQGGMQPEPPRLPLAGSRVARQVARCASLSRGQYHHGLEALQGMSL